MFATWCKKSVAKCQSRAKLGAVRLLLVFCPRSRSCARTRCFWPAACPRTGRRPPSLACGTGEWVATENFNKFHHGKVVKNIKIGARPARCSSHATSNALAWQCAPETVNFCTQNSVSASKRSIVCWNSALQHSQSVYDITNHQATLLRTVDFCSSVKTYC